MAVLMFVIIISGSALVVLYAMTNATQSLTSTRNTTPKSTLAQQNGIITPGTPIPPPRPTSGNQIRSTLVYLPVLSTSNAFVVKRGEPVTWAFRLQNNNGMSIFGKWVNFYIDDQAAKGTWYQSPDARLVYSGTDSTSLSPGVHTLKLDFLGDDTNAPCRYSMTFTVVSSESPIVIPTTTPYFPPYAMVTVAIQNNALNPSIITVARGTTVVWTNHDAGVQHTIISDSNAFSSGILKPGDTFEVKFNNPGTYNYQSLESPFMYGSVIVT